MTPSSWPDPLLETLFWLRDLGPVYRPGITGSPWFDLGLTLLVTAGGVAILWSLGQEVAGGREYQRLLRWLGGRGETWLILLYGIGVGAALAGLVVPGAIALVDVVTDRVLWATDPVHSAPYPETGRIS